MINTSYLKKSQQSETLLINEVSRLKEVAGETIFKFGFGQSPFLPPKNVIDCLASFSARKEYVDVQGIKPLREAIAKFHNHYDKLNIKEENIIVGPGSKMLIYAILAAFDDADVFVVTPSWVSYEPQAKLAKLNAIRIDTNFESRWRLTPELLEKACDARADKSKPGILILNYPGNPDGLSYTEVELKLLAETFRKYNILVISDEIYGLLNHFGSHSSIAQFYPEGTIVTSGLSKWCGAGGWRLGVGLFPECIDPTFKQTVIGIASETYSCAATPVQYAAIEAYQVGTQIEEYLAHQRRILNLCANHMYFALTDKGVKLHKPEGGFYLNPDFSDLKNKLSQKDISTNEELCTQLLKDTAVAILPGNAFGYKSDQLVARIAYVDFNGPKALAASQEIGLDKDLDDEFLFKWCPKIVEGTKRMREWLS
jgi:aspartate aminotransferase